MATTSTPESRKLFIRKLLAWYRRAARDLPWRATRNPYAILVSEFMLQQTQVSRVLDFYPRFLKRFPTMEALARARPKAVMEQWDGLGYYARARNLHALAKDVTRRHDGTLPDNPEDLQTLPGVGRYTAGAVACFAYEQAVPTVDTNVKRVLERAFAPKDVWAFAAMITPKSGKTAWKFNQALMELGALICPARKPKCPECPVRSECRLGSKNRSGNKSEQGKHAGQRRKDRLPATESRKALR
jgi:A/G-specific adenine glycosylase